MSPVTTPANRAMRRSFVIIVAISIAMNAAVLLFGIRSVNAIRGDFCTFAASVQAAAHQLPQVQGRVNAEAAYTRLQTQLDC